MRHAAPTLAVLTACAPAAPTQNRAAPPSVEVPDPRPAPSATAEVVAAPTTAVRPILVGAKKALVPDPSCLERPEEERRLLGIRALPDVAVEAKFFLAGDEVCTVSTHARAEVLLARSETLEQTATCHGWVVTPCVEPVAVALPNPPFRQAKAFDRAPDWREMDNQSDGLGQRRRDVSVSRVPGTALSLTHTRKGFVVLNAGEKQLDAFWAQAFILVDGIAHVVTPDSIVRLADPPEHRPLPILHTTDRAPTPKTRPWERQN